MLIGRVLCVGVIVVVAAVGMYAQDANHPAPAAGRHFTLNNCVSEFNPARIESTKVGYQYWFVGKEFLDGRTLKMTVVKPHAATHPPHRHAEDEFFFVLEGTAEVILNGETRVVHPYASFYCPSDSLHGIRNPGDTELKYLVIKKYATP
jgi:mannose-6-phosphate isomerase-like protein (cupin superfamily)